jgi:hypothetical protein
LATVASSGSNALLRKARCAMRASARTCGGAVTARASLTWRRPLAAATGKPSSRRSDSDDARARKMDRPIQAPHSIEIGQPNRHDLLLLELPPDVPRAGQRLGRRRDRNAVVPHRRATDLRARAELSARSSPSSEITTSRVPTAQVLSADNVADSRPMSARGSPRATRVLSVRRG